MNINCSICSDLFIPTSAIYVTRCGHIFHYTCLIQWIERSKTCPQCRNKTNEKSIFRIFFNFLTSEGIEDDAVTLQNKLDALNLQLRLKESHVKSTEEKIKIVTDENNLLEIKNKELRSDVDRYKSGIASIKDQLNFYKDKAKHVEKVETEMKLIKDKLRAKEEASKALTGSLEEANKIIYNSNCPKTLSVIASSLKRELQATEKKKNNIFSLMKKKENELHLCRKELNVIQEERDKLKHDLLAHKQCETEMQTLKKKIAEIMENTSSVDPSLVRIVTESPAPLLSKPKNRLNILSSEFVDSPTVADRIKEIKDSDSPYLNMKTNTIGLLLNNQEIGTKYGNSSMSIFKKSVSSSTLKKSSSECNYNGLGGHSKDEKFPVSKPTTGLKRTKSSTMTSSKFRKLAKPYKKLDEFLDVSDID